MAVRGRNATTTDKKSVRECMIDCTMGAVSIAWALLEWVTMPLDRV